jgi:hypothetical protein
VLRGLQRRTQIVLAAAAAITVLAVLAVFFSSSTAPLSAGSDSDPDTRISIVPRPSNLAPSDQTTIYGSNVTLEWAEAPGADHYIVMITVPDGSMAPLNLTTTHDRYDLLDVLPDGRFVWTVTAMDNNTYGPASVATSFTIRTSLDAPGPVSPANGSVVVNDLPALRWSAVPGADTYRLQVSASPAYEEPLVDILINGTSYQLDLDLKDDTVYYWHVSSNREEIWSSWSVGSGFSFDLFLPSPVLLSPQSGTTVTNGQVNISWDAVADADRYRIQVSKNVNFTSLVINEVVTDTWFEPASPLATDTTYHWRVRAGNAETLSSWSSISILHMGPENIPFSYTWMYAKKSWTLNGTVPSNDYYALHDRNRTYDYASYVMTDPTVVKVAGDLEAMAQANGYGTAEFILAFVQGLNYTSDQETTGQAEWPRYPAETLVDGGGDCEDKAVLYVSLMQSSPVNVDMVLLEYTKPGQTGHMAAGISGNYAGISFSYSGKDFYLCETTVTGWDIGERPPEIVGFDVEVLPC